MNETLTPKPSEYNREAEFIRQRRQENQEVSDIADQHGLLGESASIGDVLKFVTQTRVLKPSLVKRMFEKVGLIKSSK